MTRPDNIQSIRLIVTNEFPWNLEQLYCILRCDVIIGEDVVWKALIVWTTVI